MSELTELKACTACNGTGFQSAAQNMPADTSPMLVPYGTWPCQICKGTGKVPDLIKVFSNITRPSEGGEK